MIGALLAAVALLASAASVAATAQPAQGACLNVAGSHQHHSFTGTLVAERRFTSLSVSAPPQGERAHPHDPAIICITGDEFADPRRSFRSIQVWGGDRRIQCQLRAALGYRVALSGEVFPAHTGHHHAPLLMDEERRGRRFAPAPSA